MKKKLRKKSKRTITVNVRKNSNQKFWKKALTGKNIIGKYAVRIIGKGQTKWQPLAYFHDKKKAIEYAYAIKKQNPKKSVDVRSM